MGLPAYLLTIYVCCILDGLFYIYISIIIPFALEGSDTSRYLSNHIKHFLPAAYSYSKDSALLMVSTYIV